MSLGIRTFWRVRPQSLGSGLSLIPRESSATNFSKPEQRLHAQTRAASSSSSSSSSTSVDQSAGETASPLEETDKVPDQDQLLERLANVPVRRHGPRESVVIAPLTEYQNKRETKRAFNKYHEAVFAQWRLERIRAAKRIAPPDWRKTLQYLSSWTPQFSGELYWARVAVPDQTSEQLLFDIENNLWDVRSRTGCAIELHRPDTEHDSTYLILSGARPALDTALDDLAEVCKKLNITILRVKMERQDDLEPLDPVSKFLKMMLIRAARVDKAWEKYDADLGVDQMPIPDEWSKESFERYVSILTNAVVARGKASALYGPGGSHHVAVVRQLHLIFNSPEAYPHITNASLKMALGYMVRKGTPFHADARALFLRMENIGLRLDVDVFNILAEAAAIAKDLTSFQHAIRLMVKRGFTPNFHTWVLFLRIIEAEEVRRYILHAMGQKGLLRALTAMRDIAQYLAGHDIYRSIVQGKDLPTFLAEQHSLYGPSWLSRNAANRILDILGSHGKLDDMVAFVEVMFESQTAQPDEVTLNIALTHCKQLNTLAMPPRFLELFEKHGKMPRASIAHHLLLELAYSRRSPHLMDLVWRYSCMQDTTSWRMRTRVSRLMTRGRASRPPENGARRVALSQNGVVLSREGFDALEIARGLGDLFAWEFLHHGGRDREDLSHRSPAAAGTILRWYRARPWSLQPNVRLSKLWDEALAHDVQFHKAVREGTEAVFSPVYIPVVEKAERRSCEENKDQRV